MGEAAGNHNHQLQLLVGGLSFMQKKHKNNTWVAMEEDGFCDESRSGNNEEPSSSSSTSMGSPSNSSCFSENDGDEAFSSSSPSPASSSSSSSSSSSNSSSSSTLHSKNRNNDSPLYELSDLMAQLPIKDYFRRGLSKFYQGKSQSYTYLLGSVNSLEDLVKKVPSRRILKVKSKCKSFCWGLERQKHCYSPKPAISKKGSSGSRGSCFSSLPKPPPPSVATTFD